MKLHLAVGKQFYINIISCLNLNIRYIIIPFSVH